MPRPLSELAKQVRQAPVRDRRQRGELIGVVAYTAKVLRRIEDVVRGRRDVNVAKPEHLIRRL